MANLFNLNEQTLRYYNRVGLLIPYKKDKNGYRKYKIEQVYALATIRYLRNLDYSIDDIKNYLGIMGYENRITSLTEQHKLLTEKISRLENIQKAINRKTKFVEEKIKTIDLEKNAIVKCGKRKFMLLGKEKKIYLNNLFYRYITMVEYKKNKKTFLMYMDDEDELCNESKGMFNENIIKEIPAGYFFTGYHAGKHEGVTISADRIRRIGEKDGLELEDYFITTNIIDQFIESDSNKYLTEIQIPITIKRDIPI